MKNAAIMIDWTVVDTNSTKLPLISVELGKEVGELLLGSIDREFLYSMFDDWAHLIKEEDSYPIGYFQKIRIYEPYRNRGYGRCGVQLADRYFSKNRITLAIMGVTWSQSDSTDPSVQLEWRVNLYSSEGWLLDPTSPVTHPRMFKRYQPSVE